MAAACDAGRVLKKSAFLEAVLFGGCIPAVREASLSRSWGEHRVTSRAMTVRAPLRRGR